MRFEDRLIRLGRFGSPKEALAPWLAMDEWAEDSEATITIGEFRALAWGAANQKARDLGWVKSSDELHEDVKRAGGAP